MDEGPAFKAVVPHGFWMDRYEVTQKSFLDLMGENPSNTEFSPDMPVNRVTWHEAVEYCKRLTDAKGSAGLLPKGYVYRLPTEAEWEYACRAGTKGAYSYGDSAEQLSEYGWWAGNSGNQPEPVGKLKPNPWGLYDMHGNLFEWCADAYLAYPGGKAFSTTGKMKVLRGGAYYCPSNILRSACRAEAQQPDFRWILAGFRVVLAPRLAKRRIEPRLAKRTLRQGKRVLTSRLESQCSARLRRSVELLRLALCADNHAIRDSHETRHCRVLAGCK